MMADPLSPQLLDLGALATLGGQVLATTAVTNGLARAFNWQPRWLGLIVALILSLCVSYFGGQMAGSGSFLAILNAFVVYLAAAGTSGAGAAVLPEPPPKSTEAPGGFESREDRRILRPWF
jgi:hypothetical protein